MTETKAKLRLSLNYWKLFGATTVSNLGDGISMVAYVWLASAITRNPVALALVAVAGSIPRLLFTLPAGAITDRFDRRKLVGWTAVFQFVLTFLVAVAVFLGRDELSDPSSVADAAFVAPEHAGWYLALLYVAFLLFGCAEVLRDNASHTMIPALVEKRLLDRANGRLWAGEQVMNSLVGPPIGGLLIAVAFALPFFIDAGTFAIAAGLFFLIVGSFRPDRGDPSAQASWRSDIAEGVRWLWRHTLLRDLAIVLGVMNMTAMLVFSTYVLFAQEILELQATQFGLLMTGAALGGVLGGVAAERVSRVFGRGGSLYLTIFIGIAAFTITGLSSSGIIVWVAMAAFSFGAIIWNVITMSLRQSIVPDHLLGRVMSVYRLFGLGMMPVGALLGGALVRVVEELAARDVGLRSPFFVAAIVYAVLLIVAAPRLSTSKIEAAEREAEVDER